MLTPTQLDRLASLVPADLDQPARVSPELQEMIEWESCGLLQRFILVRLFGRTADRAKIATTWTAFRLLEIPLRTLANQVIHDPGIRAIVNKKLDYANRA